MPLEKSLILSGVSKLKAEALDPTIPSLTVVTTHPANTFRTTGFNTSETGDENYGMGGSASLASYVFTHSGGSWTLKTPMPVSGTGGTGTGVLAGDGNGYFFGGDTDTTAVQQLSLGSDSWVDFANMSQAHNYNGGCVNPSDATDVLQAGGNGATQLVLIFSVDTVTDAVQGTLPANRNNHYTVNTNDMNGNYAYIFGNSTSDTSCVRYVFETDTWSSVGALSYTPLACSGTGPNGQIWSCGGGSDVTTTSKMNVAAETWSAGGVSLSLGRRAVGGIGYSLVIIPKIIISYAGQINYLDYDAYGNKHWPGSVKIIYSINNV